MFRAALRLIPMAALAAGPASGDAWADRMIRLRDQAAAAGPERAAVVKGGYADLMRDHPVETDWFAARPAGDELDAEGLPRHLVEYLRTDRDAAFEIGLIEAAIAADAFAAADHRVALDRCRAEGVPAGDRRWLDLFAAVRGAARRRRLSSLRETAPRIVFVKSHPVRPSFYAYTEGLSDAQQERHFRPPSSLCLLDLDDGDVRVRALLDDPGGVIRDPDVSYDGAAVLFAWKRSDRDDDYHLYEMDVATRAVRPLTAGRGVADYEGRYLPDGSIVFASTRCIQTVDCFWTEVSNLYVCDRDGGAMRRLGYDQVHTTQPSVLPDGSIVYTRWDYNDRGQVFPQGLFRMNPDGTGQAEYYGNNSWFPTVIHHARAIPGADALVAVLHGHHTWQAGPLAIVDRRRGTQEDVGVRLIAPQRVARPVRVDAYGQDGALFRYPWPLSEREFLVSMTPDKDARRRGTPFHLYWIDLDGRRELLARDAILSCGHPVPLGPRPRPPVWPASAAAGGSDAVLYVQDVYAGPGLTDVPRGSIRSLRVVALEYRAAGIGHNHNRGEAGAALISTPISIGPGAWDVKRVLGEAPVREDGSAMFAVPSRTPLYLQAIDRDGHAAQTMRSWATLMPGEIRGCVGCHEEKHQAPPVSSSTLAAQAGPSALAPFHVPPRGFSFPRDIQPILDRHCVACHDGTAKEGRAQPLFPLTGASTPDALAKRNWSEAYVRLLGAVPASRSGPPADYRADADRPLLNWISAQSRPTALPPYHRGSARSELIRRLREGHGDTRLDRAEIETLCAWIDLGVPFCGDYTEANAWTGEERKKYQHFLDKRARYAAHH